MQIYTFLSTTEFMELCDTRLHSAINQIHGLRLRMDESKDPQPEQVVEQIKEIVLKLTRVQIDMEDMARKLEAK